MLRNLKKSYISKYWSTIPLLLLFSSVTYYSFYAYQNPIAIQNTYAQPASPTSPSVSDKIIYWKSLLYDNPEYFPGWIELAYLYTEENNLSLAREALYEAKNIKPNSSEVKIVETMIVKNNLLF